MNPRAWWLFGIAVILMDGHRAGTQSVWSSVADVTTLPSASEILKTLSLRVEDFAPEAGVASVRLLSNPDALWTPLTEMPQNAFRDITVPTPSSLQNFRVAPFMRCGSLTTTLWRTREPIGTRGLTALVKRTPFGLRAFGTDPDGTLFQSFAFDQAVASVRQWTRTQDDGAQLCQLRSPLPSQFMMRRQIWMLPESSTVIGPAPAPQGPYYVVQSGWPTSLKILVLTTPNFVSDLADNNEQKARADTDWLVDQADTMFRYASIELCPVSISAQNAVLSDAEVKRLDEASETDWAEVASKIVADHAGNLDYDIGHILRADSQSTGNALPASLGTINKGAGETRLRSLDHVTIFAHEIAHQLGAGHTFNGAEFASDWDGDSAVEPGSGVTLMSYASRAWVGADRLEEGRLPYLHAGSIAEIREHVERVKGKPTVKPSFSIRLVPKDVANIQVPPRTPIRLEAVASPANPGLIQFRWDELDVGTTQTAVPPRFRSYIELSAARDFPKPSALHLLGAVVGESRLDGKLAKFRVVAWNTVTGAAASRDLNVQIVGTKALAIHQPVNDAWTGKQKVTLKWEAPEDVGVKDVRISISLDGGATWKAVPGTFPIDCGDGTGAATFDSPEASDEAVVKIEAVGSVFYSQSRAFRIKH